MSAPDRNLQTLARALAAGYTVGPSAHCRGCHVVNDDRDAIDRGVCDECWHKIEVVNHQECRGK
jgi:hypothetical protein